MRVLVGMVRTIAMLRPSWANSAIESAAATSEPATPTFSGVCSRAASTQNTAPPPAMSSVVPNSSTEFDSSESRPTLAARSDAVCTSAHR